MVAPLALGVLPFIIYFNQDPKFEEEPKLVPALIAAAIVFPFVYLMMRNYDVIRLSFDEVGITVSNVFGAPQNRYSYSDVAKIDFSTHKIEGVVSRGGRTRDINYVSFITICLKDGDTIELSSDVYSNYEQMIEYIESHKDVVQIM
jgi:hypothetical protein